MTEFTIVICAFNATGRLQRTLEHLAALDYPSELVEIILVDNNSTDDTGSFAQDIWNNLISGFCFRVVSENQQGISRARMRGIYESRYDHVVFCDDDNWLDPQYLTFANDVLTQNRYIGVLGGQGVPVTDADSFPNWFYTFSGGYAVGVQGMKSGDISERGFVWGAGAVVRRDFLVKVFSSGCEFLLSGRKGEKLLAGDDCEMCKWFLIAGYRLWYDERMLFYHFIPSIRLTAGYLQDLFSGFSETKKILERYDQYLLQQSIRQEWKRIPFTSLKREFELLIDRDENKLKVFRLIRKVRRFHVTLGLDA